MNEFPKIPIKILFDTLAYASEKHQGQRRKGGHRIPYINHPIKVVQILLHCASAADPILVQAALLHDTLEDTTSTFEELRTYFGTEVARTVSEVTDDMTLPLNERKQLQVKNAPYLSVRAKKIRIADKIANLKDLMDYPPRWPMPRKLKYTHWAEQVVKACGKVDDNLESEFLKVLRNCRNTLDK